MTQEHLNDANRDAHLLGLALTTSAERVRLHEVAGSIAHVWQRAGVPLSDALECARNAVQCMSAEAGVHHILLDAIEHRRGQPELYPAWQSVSRSRAMYLATLALGVWCTKGWRR